MKQFAILMAAVLTVILFVYMLSRLSSDALGMAVGVVFGVLAGIPTALLVLASSRKQDDDDFSEWGNVDDFREWQRQQQGERQLGQPFPYQPPVIVLAAPMEDKPQVVNNTYNDNRSVTIHAGAASSVPTIYDRQRQIAAERGGKEVQRVGHNGQGARVFRVVGQREEGDE